ncbi:hypothetical protein H8B06_02195 [Sphingobacterium sp. DN00404]|uniref:Lipoprotein n=1 Tax=Sphingobacterium micropteri TaxID=2763501 RepID=A0ABR7YJZ0_9SPHI|nr:hypothetical protein [Sphingobacterium micropteri]MBD1431622.1 hypothetical protein [Sphingobacterium micropteri]
MKLYKILFAVMLSFLLASCDFVANAYKETFQDQQHTEVDTVANTVAVTADFGEQKEEIPAVEPINILEDAEKLAEVQEKLQAMFPGKPLSIYPPHIYFDTDRIRLQVLDPNIQDNIDWYYYNAEADVWEKKEPVKTSVRIVREPIPLAAVQFSTAHRVYRQVLDKVTEVEGAEVPSSVYFTFNVPQWNWNARIVGTRADYAFKADKNGKQLEFKKQ